MVKYLKVQSMDRPLDIEITSEKVFLAKDIALVEPASIVKEELPGHEQERRLHYEYTLEEYTKDEYLLKLQADVTYLSLLTEV